MPRVGNASGPVGGDPPPLALISMIHVFFLEVIERDASGHGDVCQGVRVETQVAEGGGSAYEHSGGLRGLRETLGDVDGVQVPQKVL